MTKHLERPYVITNSSVAMEGGRGSGALTRDAIRLEVAMRLTINGKSPSKAWEISDEFIAEMDSRLPELPETPTNNNNNQKLLRQ